MRPVSRFFVPLTVLNFLIVLLGVMPLFLSADDAAPKWNYRPELLRPFWEGDTMEGESVLFIRNEQNGEARASVLFPITEVLAVRNSVGDVTYESGKDYLWKPESREIVLPAGSRIPSFTAKQLRRPAKSQQYQLTHRDGDGEIFFGGRLEYAEMQTCITYRHAEGLWKGPLPKFDETALPKSIHKLLHKKPLSIVVVGDSISAGANASGLFDAAPHQPAYPGLLQRHLEARFQSSVSVINPSVSGKDTAWVLGSMDLVLAPKPDLVVIAFGMNDSAGRPAAEYQANTKQIIDNVREKLPDCEFILVASMLGNRDWITLKHELFPQYREKLLELAGPGIAVADLTSIWTGFLEAKQDWDQTGNGVNHPNDWGHRVYAQVISALLIPPGQPVAASELGQDIESGPLRFREKLLLGNHTYAYACASHDLDGDGDLDLTSADAEPNCNLYLLRNDGQGSFSQSYIQKFQGKTSDPFRMERHALGDVNGDGLTDIVIVDNMKWDIRWFQNPGADHLSDPWPLHRVAQPGEVPGSYDVALADFDADGDLDVACSSWRFGNRFDWFENTGRGDQASWPRHDIDVIGGETRTIAVADFNRDGRPDLLGTARTTHQVVWYANSSGSVSGTTSPSWIKTVIDGQTVAPTHGHPIDMDHDGDIDVVMAFGIVAPVPADSPESHQVVWYENVGTSGDGSTWAKHLIHGGFNQGFEAVAGDLDGDGDLDVIATAWGQNGQLAWFENTGDQTAPWPMHSLKQNWPNANTVIVSDLDGDQRLDIVATAERGANELRWWRNLGSTAVQ